MAVDARDGLAANSAPSARCHSCWSWSVPSLLGFFFTWLIPELDIATGIAPGAIVSPTDAVATSIAKRVGAPSRVIAVLEGESMLNDASALVLLRAAVAATASPISFAGWRRTSCTRCSRRWSSAVSSAW